MTLWLARDEREDAMYSVTRSQSMGRGGGSVRVEPAIMHTFRAIAPMKEVEAEN